MSSPGAHDRLAAGRRWSALRIVALVVDILAAVSLVLCILLQSGRGAGFSGFTGPGASGAEFFFGRKKGMDEALGRITAVLAAVFFASSFVLAHYWGP